MCRKVCYLLTTAAVLMGLGLPVAATEGVQDITPRMEQPASQNQSAAAETTASTPKLPLLSDLNLSNFVPKPVQETDLSVSAESVNGHYPISVDATEQEGVVRLVKTFVVAEGVQPDVLTEKSLQRNGVKLTLTDVAKKDILGESEVKPVSDTKTAAGKDKESATTALPATLEYNKDGYFGTLTLDNSTVKIEAQGETPYAYVVAETKIYRRITRNDPVLLDKTIIKNGATLHLKSVEWTDVGKGDGSVAGPFDAVATYKGTTSGVKATEYEATGTYTGDAVRKGAGQTEYTLIYEGSIPAAPTASEVVEQVDKVFPIGKMLAGLGIFLLAGGGMIGGIFWWKQRSARREEFDESDNAPTHENASVSQYDNRPSMDRPRILDELNRGGEDET